MENVEIIINGQLTEWYLTTIQPEIFTPPYSVGTVYTLELVSPDWHPSVMKVANALSERFDVPAYLTIKSTQDVILASLQDISVAHTTSPLMDGSVHISHTRLTATFEDVS